MSKKFFETMGVDQYGQYHHSLGKHPRKTLLARLCRTKAIPMYRDDSRGNAVKVGWIIGGLEIEVFKVTPLYEKGN